MIGISLSLECVESQKSFGIAVYRCQICEDFKNKYLANTKKWNVLACLTLFHAEAKDSFDMFESNEEATI